MTLLVEHLSQILIVLGLLALIVEVAVLGFATFVLFFLGLSLVLSGLMMSVGLLDATLMNALWVNALLTAALAGVLWQPLKRMQAKTQSTEVNSDFADITFTLSEDLNEQSQLTHAYSGITWQLKSETPIAKGTTVKVVKKSVGVLWVAALERQD
ncbi:NfeD family protein [Pseudoalteromonas ardens]|uniref:Activity regulator of membrane protease YbbK n=1 Tax=Pseudoalteromonas rubra TaxID=43658 RepID=A0A0L0EVG9_9GAMM|nr:activity regulator of membrane protease YbbK [Pseudoalteromonas sp. R96]KNC68457.1 activity regulator of membrane protease YbbK [Pseudoalteromonas rubra]MDK1309747.1 NfeD family protein [Pseudoalteromonas sp. R96]